MKKIITAFSATLILSALVACSAADDSRINGPRMGYVSDPSAPAAKTSASAIDQVCSTYSLIEEEEHDGEVYGYYYCKSNGNYYGCTTSECFESEDDDD